MANLVCLPYAVVLVLLVMSVLTAYAQRGTPPESPRSEPARTPGYCDSYGGSTWYESISDVTWTIDDNNISFVVEIFIANPTGCSSGNPCPEYDDSPEYVNGWIDWNGNHTWEPSEQVINMALTGYLNINYSGIMTGYAQATIPPNHVGQTYLRVNLGWGDDPNDPCWEYWNWGNVVDYAIELEETSFQVDRITVLGGNPIREIPDGVIWLKEFNCMSGGGDRISFDEYPISVPRNSSFSLRLHINSCPTSVVPPSWECGWNYTDATPSGGMSFTPSWEHIVVLRSPNTVDSYTLELRVTYTDPNTFETSTETIQRKVLVTYTTPITASPRRIWYEKACSWGSGAINPDNVVLNVRGGLYNYGRNHWWYGYFPNTCNWQQLVGDDPCHWGDCYRFSEVMENMCSVLGVPLGWTTPPQGSTNNGFVTVSNGAGTGSLDPGFPGNVHPYTGGAYNRYKFSSHSLRKFGTRYQDATYNKDYGTDHEFIAWNFDNPTMTTTIEGPTVTKVAPPENVYERNGFGCWGNYGYSPAADLACYTLTGWDGPIIVSNVSGTSTQSQSRAGQPAFIDWAIHNAGGRTTVGFDVRILVDGNPVASWTVTPPLEQNSSAYIQDWPYTFASQGSHIIRLEADYQNVINESSNEGNNWCEIPVDVAPPLATASLPDKWGTPQPELASLNGQVDAGFNRPMLATVIMPNGMTRSRSLDSDLMHFTGVVSYTPVDQNGDGFYEALTAEVSFIVTQPGNYVVKAWLEKNGAVIANRPQYYYMLPTQFSYSGLAGTIAATLDFSGEQIFQSGEDGPYTLVAFGYSTNGQEDQLNHVTPSFPYVQFGELGAGFAASSDEGIDTDGDGDFNILRTHVGLAVRTAGTYAVIAALMKDSVNISNASVQQDLASGFQNINVDFPGRVIRSKGLNGPYRVSLILQNSEGSSIAGSEHTTQAYQANNFDLAALQLNGTHSDFGMDLNGNGHFDVLRFQLGVQVDSAGTYEIAGWLAEPASPLATAGEAFAFANTSVSLAVGNQTITLDFPGTIIQEHGVNGPYALKFLEVKGADYLTILHVQPEYPTQFYQANQFEGAPVMVQYTGNHDDYAVDNNGNSRYDELIVRMEAVFDTHAVILGFAELRDADGRTIAQGSGFAEVQAGSPTMIPIHFDGRYVFGNLRNGPYHILNAFLYPSGDINFGVHVSDVGMTQPYNYENFEPAAVITGVVRSTSSGLFPVGAELNSSDATDYVDALGKYRLIYIGNGVKHVTLSAPEFPEAVWSVYHNGIYIGTQNFADLSVEVGRIDTLDFLTDNVLPVELLSFTAIPGDNMIELRWATASETDNASFDIQRNGNLVASVPAAGEAHTYEWTDRCVLNGTSYSYTLVSVDLNSMREELQTVEATPIASNATITEYALLQNYPNPFNPSTQITFDMKESGYVTLTIYNFMGQEVKVLVNGNMDAGRHRVNFVDAGLPSGLYICRMETAAFSATKKMLLMK
jgi:hypothetical protein